MGADSLFGGNTDLGSQVSSASQSLIDRFLTDTVATSVVKAAIGGSTVLVASGGSGEKQGALLPASNAITGSIDDGVLKVSVSLPANSGFVFEGKDNVSPSTAGEFLQGMIDAYLPPTDTGVAALRASLATAVNDLVEAAKAQGVTQVVVRVIDFVNGATSARSASDALRADGDNDVVFDTTAMGGDASTLFAFNLGQLSVSQDLVLKGVKNAMVVGQGSVVVGDDTGIRITSDFASQEIVGGAGNDTLIGGGGSDTLTGGAGNDVFAFSRLGHFTVEDFTAGADKLAFNVAGVSNTADLAALVTSVTSDAQGVTYHFGNDASITLVGLSMFDVGADMLEFSF